jgi:hypothetical protein
MPSELHQFINKPYTFRDGVELKIIQIKTRDEHVEWVTYTSTHQGSLPQKLVLTAREFFDKFGHLYGLKEIPKQP